jgi:Family of unknown function (DUF6079)
MKYADLFTLNPIETIIELNDADKKEKARKLVSRFVMTPALREAIEDVALPQLDFGSGVEGKGIFVVGNYGTGKSHVMSVLSLIAQDASYLEQLRDPEQREKLRPIAGRYRVRRTELGASTMPLYDAVTQELQALAKQVGFDFHFKGQHEVVNIKTELQRYMSAFDACCPGQGVFYIIDELLEFLRSRGDDLLMLDLPVLRILGEFCDGSRFVFMAGIQQMLFQDRRFNHLADEVKRVGQRFYDLSIDDRSVAQLIEQYLFQKNEAQRQQIRELLKEQFGLYEILAPEVEQFVALFPAHPRFISEFQRVFVVERREILTVLSREAKTLLNQEVDADQLGLITADRYWLHVESDQRLRSNREVSKVVQNVATIAAHVRQEFAPNEDQEGALRLVRALAVNRLTTPTINDPVGLTPHDLKNNLLWRTPVAMADAEFLTAAAKRLLERARAAANGQFLAVSETSGQYYIDPTRDRDYPQQVKTYAATISKQVVQRYLNELFTRALELPNTDAALENRLWKYPLLWGEKNVDRPGWLFFGFPNQRSTAQPPRDFYLFVIPSRRITGLEETWPDAEDEAYWFLEDFSPANCDRQPSSVDGENTFLDFVYEYAAACELAIPSRGDEKTAFVNIATKLRQKALPQFTEKAGEWIAIRFNGQRKRFAEWVAELAPAQQNALFKTKLDAISQAMFAAHFQRKYPDYPTFSSRVSEGNRAQEAQAALEMICKVGQTTKMGQAVLEALELYEAGTATPDRSPWLGKIRERLKALGSGQVLNNTDLFEKREGRVWMKDEGLEAEWLHVVLAAGIEAGDLVVMGSQNARFDATGLREFYREVKSWEQVVRIARPSEVPVDRWRKLFHLVGANEGLLANPNTYTNAITLFQGKVGDAVQRLVADRQKLQSGLPFQAPEAEVPLGKTAETLGVVKESLEALQSLNSRAKMQNLAMQAPEIDQLAILFQEGRRVEKLLEFTAQHQRELGALQRYEDILERDQGFQERLTAFKATLNAAYADLVQFDDAGNLEAMERALKETIAAALATYQTLYRQHSLDREGDKRKKQLMEGSELKQLNKLTFIGAINQSALESVREALGKLPVYKSCTDEDLLNSPTSLAPSKWDPRTLEADAVPAFAILERCEQEIARLHREWTEQLLNELEDPAIHSTLSALKPEEKLVTETFLAAHALPQTVDDKFVSAVNTALSGLRRRPIRAEHLARAVLGDGVPLKVTEVEERFKEWVKGQMNGDQPETVRFVLEE